MRASELWPEWEKAKKFADHTTDCSDLLVDSTFDAVNISIILKNSRRFSDAEAVLRKTIDAFPLFPPAFHELSLALRYQNNHLPALRFARRAYELDRGYKNLLVLQLCACGLTEEALSILFATEWTTQASFHEDRVYIEFAKFMTNYPIFTVEGAIKTSIETGNFLGVEQVEQQIVAAIAAKRPFALTRLGDGEGSWTYISRKDEYQFGSLYRMNRISFLNDWFGSDALIDDESFFNFATSSSQSFDHSDILGVTDIARMRHEYSLMSMRGLTASINVLRSTGILDSKSRTNARFCSNSVHHLLDRRGFFQRLFQHDLQFGVITSHPNLPKILETRGAKVGFAYYTPGDSRNFWRGEDGRPLCQYPDTFQKIRGELQSKDLTGVVVLVGAGFVGKQYMAIIRQRGGIAIDIGGIADVWMRAAAN